MINRIFSSLDRVAIEYNKAGVKIVNAGYNSAVKSFPKQDFYDALNYSQDRIDDLFKDLIVSKGIPSIDWLLEKAVMIDEDWADSLDVVVAPIDKTNEFVKKKVLDYLPLGPYKGNTYFVKRSLLKC